MRGMAPANLDIDLQPTNRLFALGGRKFTAIAVADDAANDLSAPVLASGYSSAGTRAPRSMVLPHISAHSF